MKAFKRLFGIVDELDEYYSFIFAIKKKNVQQVESYLKGINPEKLSSIVNTTNGYDRERALHYASDVGSVEIINLLLKYQAEVNVFDRKKRSPLHRAIIGGNEEAARVLIRAGIDLNNKNASGRNALSYAIDNSMIPVVKDLLKFGAKLPKDDYLMSGAIMHDSLELVKVLHYAGVSLIKEHPFGSTPLMSACCFERFSIAEYILNNGASPNTISRKHGTTALRLCIQKINNPDVFKQFLELLIAHDVDLEVLDASDFPNNNEILCILIKYCLGVNCENEWWFRNCLSLVIQRGITSYNDLNHLVKLVICAGLNFKDFTDLKDDWSVESLEFIEYSMSRPRSLKDLCRIRIRKLLGKKAMLNLYKLDLSKSLYKFLALEIL